MSQASYTFQNWFRISLDRFKSTSANVFARLTMQRSSTTKSITVRNFGSWVKTLFPQRPLIVTNDHGTGWRRQERELSISVNTFYFYVTVTRSPRMFFCITIFFDAPLTIILIYVSTFWKSLHDEVWMRSKTDAWYQAQSESNKSLPFF